jgi:hypothetical protein
VKIRKSVSLLGMADLLLKTQGGMPKFTEHATTVKILIRKNSGTLCALKKWG